MSFAPTPSGGLFTSTTGAAASNTLTIPRFSDSLDITKNLANFALCTTALLYPYVVNTAGFDTGLAIANTTTDPFGTTAQVGTCTLNFYGSSCPGGSLCDAEHSNGYGVRELSVYLSPGLQRIHHRGLQLPVRAWIRIRLRRRRPELGDGLFGPYHQQRYGQRVAVRKAKLWATNQTLFLQLEGSFGSPLFFASALLPAFETLGNGDTLKFSPRPKPNPTSSLLWRSS